MPLVMTSLPPARPAGASRVPPAHEALRIACGPALAQRFHVWRGTSGRRYVVSAYAPSTMPDYRDVIALAVGRGRNGRLAILGAAVTGEDPLALFPGAEEIHLHLLAQDPAARRAVLADLGWPQ